jgi:hypothetical protein
MATLPTAMAFDDLARIVDEMLRNADANGRPVWRWPIDKIVGDLAGSSDDILACEECDIHRAVEMALEQHEAMTAFQ